MRAASRFSVLKMSVGHFPPDIPPGQFPPGHFPLPCRSFPPPGHSPPTNDEVCYMRMMTLRCEEERLNRPLCGITFTKYIKCSCYFE